MTEAIYPLMPITRTGPVAVVSFNRPDQRNAFNLSMWQGLQATMEALSADNDLRCGVLRGEGAAFSAGADIKAFEHERGSRDVEDVYAQVFHTSMQSIRRCRHPVIAAISGFCLGGGAGIATMCDFRVGGEGISFGVTARKLSLWYSYEEMDPVITLAGSGVAAEIFIEGRIFNGREAYEKGLLSRVVPDEQVDAEAMALAQRIAEGAPLSARFHKAAIQKLRGELPITKAESLAVSDFAQTEDFQNAVKAFKEKRSPVWRAR